MPEKEVGDSMMLLLEPCTENVVDEEVAQPSRSSRSNCGPDAQNTSVTNVTEKDPSDEANAGSNLANSSAESKRTCDPTPKG